MSREQRINEFAQKWGSDGVPHPASLPLGMGQAFTEKQVRDDLEEYSQVIANRRKIYHY